MRIIICLIIAAMFGIACDSPEPLPPNIASPLRTPDGSEVKLACPPSLTDADPAKLKTAMAQVNVHTPASLDVLGTLVPPAPPNALWTLVPLDSPDGSVSCCSQSDNQSFGSPEGGGGLFGFGAGEEQLKQMGRLCGGIAESKDGALRMRVDLYAAVPGAKEAFKREAEVMASDDFFYKDIQSAYKSLLLSLGDERMFFRQLKYAGEKPQLLDIDDYELLFRRRNIIARLELSYYATTPQKGPPEPLLEYAAQLDQNIQAAAPQ